MKYSRTIEGDSIVIADENGKVLLIIEEAMADGFMSFTLRGELLNEIAYELEDEVMAGLSVIKQVKINMSELSYIGSVGLRSLLKIQNIIDETDNAELVLENLDDNIKQVFISNGFLDLFSIK